MDKGNALAPKRLTTGITGLDDILCGGLPVSRLYLVDGMPGSGKTTLALQFLLSGAAAGQTCLYITLSETRHEIEEVAASHGWSLDKLHIVELSALEQKIAAEAQSTLFHPSEVELTETTKYLIEAVERTKPQRVAFDSCSELRLLAQTPLRYRRQILALKQYFSGQNCTTLLLDDATAGEADSHVQSIAHGVITLEQLSPEYGASRRRLIVRKIRGSTFRGGHHDFAIQTGGLQVYPRLVAAEYRHSFKPENISSEVPGLDALLGGGLARGTSNLFSGPPGSGKSTLALSYAIAAARRGEKVLIYTFDESLNVLLARARGLNLELEPFMDNGTIRVVQVDPAEMSPGELAFQIHTAVQTDGVRMVYLDSLNGYLHAMGEERWLNLQLHELLTYLNQLGVVTILVLSPQGLLGQMQTPIDLTYLADTVMALRFFELAGSVRKAISVIKKRTGKHETTIRELRIDRSGITVGPPLDKFRGVLSGVPVATTSAEAEEILKVSDAHPR
jgi:circadian clock protein KaiC